MLESAGDKNLPAGYAESGLIVFFDGILSGSDPNAWTDLISGKQFALTSVKKRNNGLVFDAWSSKGTYQGMLTENYANETIEFSCSGLGKTQFVLSQPLIDGASGASFLVGADGMNSAMVADGRSRQRWVAVAGSKTVSVNDDNAVMDGLEISKGTSDSWGGNATGITYLGQRNGNGISGFRGTLYTLRIYNRKLSVAEMQANQATDALRYGLTY